MALQALENGYFKYREIVQNLDTGRKFYNDLGKLLARWREGVKNWRLERMAEARALEGDLVAEVGKMRISGPGSGGVEVSPNKAPNRTAVNVDAALRTLKPAHQQPAHSATPHQVPEPVSAQHIPHSLPILPKAQQPVSPYTPPPTARPITLNGPSTPLPAPMPTRVIPPPQIPSPKPGLWMGDGSTPIRFGGGAPEGNRKGAGGR